MGGLLANYVRVPRVQPFHAEPARISGVMESKHDDARNIKVPFPPWRLGLQRHKRVLRSSRSIVEVAMT